MNAHTYHICTIIIIINNNNEKILIPKEISYSFLGVNTPGQIYNQLGLIISYFQRSAVELQTSPTC